MLVTADPEAINTVLVKRKDFIKPKIYESLNIYGKNVDTLNGEEWARHRKITAPCFNERVSGLVWDESLCQAKAMAHHWLAQNDGKTNNVAEDTRIVALHILTAAGFGITQDFAEGSRKPAPGHELSLRESLLLILSNLFTAIIGLWKVNFLHPFLPKDIKRIGLAVKEFGKYMDEILQHERQARMKDPGSLKPNLISSLVRASDEAKEAPGVNSSVPLSDEEIKGNIFIFHLAGHDTTANTLAYSFTLLALYPEYQKWLMEEIKEVVGAAENPEYETSHPRLKRCLAVMYETLRLYGPVPGIPRGAFDENNPTSIPLSTLPQASPVSIPPNTDIMLNLYGAHTSSLFNPDPFTFRPTRWIDSNNNLLEQPLGFQPWSVGPRICPGMKMAQVEYTAVLSTVLSRCRVCVNAEHAEPGKELEGQELEDAKEGLRKCLGDSALIGPTFTLRRPDDIWLQCFKR
jgi:cytochrome P450